MMKISKSLRDIYSSQSEQHKQLQERVDCIMNALKDRRWHYESRVKDLESFALKVETGRYDDPNHVEDFFACTLVVENLDSMSKAEKFTRNSNFMKGAPRAITSPLNRQILFVLTTLGYMSDGKMPPLFVPPA